MALLAAITIASLLQEAIFPPQINGQISMKPVKVFNAKTPRQRRKQEMGFLNFNMTAGAHIQKFFMNNFSKNVIGDRSYTVVYVEYEATLPLIGGRVRECSRGQVDATLAPYISLDVNLIGQQLYRTVGPYRPSPGRCSRERRRGKE